jgi:probable HAF family extracellular repeat protein
VRAINGLACAAFVVACGGSNPPTVDLKSGDTGSPPVQATVTLTVSGPGTVVSSAPGSSCTATCSLSAAKGALVHLEARPDPGGLFTGWSGACTGTGGCDLTVESAISVAATFEGVPPPPPPSQHLLAVEVVGSGILKSDPPGIECPGRCSGTFAEGTSVTLLATPAAGFKFHGFGGACAGSTCSLKLAADARVAASFVSLPSRRVTVHVTGDGRGKVASDPPGIDCPGRCAAEFVEGTRVTLSARPGALSKYSLSLGACSTMPCALDLVSDADVLAVFQLRRYVLVDLGEPQRFSVGGSISPHGKFIVGSDAMVGPWLRASGTFIDLGLAVGGSFVGGVNDAGVVAGTHGVTAVRWQDGVVIELGTLGGESSATGINNAGVIVGYSNRADGTQRAVSWTFNRPTDLGSLPGQSMSAAAAINDTGLIVGSSWNLSYRPRAVAFRGPGAIEDLGTLGGPLSAALGVSDPDLIVGYSMTGAGDLHGFFRAGGRMVDVGVVPGMFGSQLFSVNSAGMAVGYSWNSTGGVGIAYGEGRLVNLNDLIDNAQGIVGLGRSVDENGRIVGEAIIGGWDHAILLEPH